MTNLHDQDVDYLEWISIKLIETVGDWFTTRNICDIEALANLAKNSCMQIKIGLWFMIDSINHYVVKIFVHGDVNFVGNDDP